MWLQLAVIALVLLVAYYLVGSFLVRNYPLPGFRNRDTYAKWNWPRVYKRFGIIIWRVRTVLQARGVRAYLMMDWAKAVDNIELWQHRATGKICQPIRVLQVKAFKKSCEWPAFAAFQSSGMNGRKRLEEQVRNFTYVPGKPYVQWSIPQADGVPVIVRSGTTILLFKDDKGEIYYRPVSHVSIYDFVPIIK